MGGRISRLLEQNQNEKEAIGQKSSPISSDLHAILRYFHLSALFQILRLSKVHRTYMCTVVYNGCKAVALSLLWCMRVIACVRMTGQASEELRDKHTR